MLWDLLLRVGRIGNLRHSPAAHVAAHVLLAVAAVKDLSIDEVVEQFELTREQVMRAKTTG